MQPALDGDLLALVPADVFDVDVVMRECQRAVSNRCRCARRRVLRRTPAGVAGAGELHQVGAVVADLLHRHQRAAQSIVPVERHEVIVVAAAVVVHVRRDQVLGDRLDRVGDVAHQVRVAEVEADAGARCRRDRRSSRATSDPASDSSFGITSSATRTPSGSASRQISSSASERRRAVLSPALCSPRRAEVHDEHIERNRAVAICERRRRLRAPRPAAPRRSR